MCRLLWEKMLNFQLGIFFITCIVGACYARMSFNNINCTSLDKNFSEFDYCYLKAVNRSYQYMSLKVRLYKLPIDNITLRLAIKKRANGYKPFLYDVTLDGCAYLRNRNNPIGNLFIKIIAGFTNMNHTCPYNHDLIVEKVSSMRIDELFTNYLPVPRGDYALFTTWSAYNVPRAMVNIYVKLD